MLISIMGLVIVLAFVYGMGGFNIKFKIFGHEIFNFTIKDKE